MFCCLSAKLESRWLEPVLCPSTKLDSRWPYPPHLAPPGVEEMANDSNDVRLAVLRVLSSPLKGQSFVHDGVCRGMPQKIRLELEMLSKSTNPAIAICTSDLCKKCLKLDGQAAQRKVNDCINELALKLLPNDIWVKPWVAPGWFVMHVYAIERMQSAASGLLAGIHVPAQFPVYSSRLLSAALEGLMSMDLGLCATYVDSHSLLYPSEDDDRRPLVDGSPSSVFAHVVAANHNLAQRNWARGCLRNVGMLESSSSMHVTCTTSTRCEFVDQLECASAGISVDRIAEFAKFELRQVTGGCCPPDIAAAIDAACLSRGAVVQAESDDASDSLWRVDWLPVGSTHTTHVAAGIVLPLRGLYLNGHQELGYEAVRVTPRSMCDALDVLDGSIDVDAAAAMRETSEVAYLLTLIRRCRWWDSVVATPNGFTEVVPVEQREAYVLEKRLCAFVGGAIPLPPAGLAGAPEEYRSLQLIKDFAHPVLSRLLGRVQSGVPVDEDPRLCQFGDACRDGRVHESGVAAALRAVYAGGVHFDLVDSGLVEKASDESVRSFRWVPVRAGFEIASYPPIEEPSHTLIRLCKRGDPRLQKIAALCRTQFDGCNSSDTEYRKLLFEKAKELVPGAGCLYYEQLQMHLRDVLSCMFGPCNERRVEICFFDQLRSRLFVLLTASDRVDPRMCDRLSGQDVMVEWASVSEMSGRQRKCGGELVDAMVELALKAEIDHIPDKFVVDTPWQQWKAAHEGIVTWEVRTARKRHRVLSGAFVDALADSSLR